MEIFKTPFSRAYWSCALRDFKKTRNLVFAALMVAACVALSYLESMPVVNNIKITWGFLARALCALVGGPVMGIVFGAVEDTVSFMLHPTGAYNPYYMFTTVLGVFTYALCLYRCKVTVWRIFLAKLLTNVQNVFLGGLGTYLFYSSKGYWVIVTASAAKNASMLPVQTAALIVLFAALLPVLHRMGYLPDQATEGLRLWVARIKGLAGKVKRINYMHSGFKSICLVLLSQAEFLWFAAPFAAVNLATVNDQPAALRFITGNIPFSGDLAETSAYWAAVLSLCGIILCILCTVYQLNLLTCACAVLTEIPLAVAFVDVYRWADGDFGDITRCLGMGFWGIVLLLLATAVLAGLKRRPTKTDRANAGNITT